jgi:hypothetical protein
MKRTTAWVAAGVLAAGCALGTSLHAAGGSQDKWIHVRVIDGGDDRPETVKVNMPIEALLSMSEAIEDEHFKNGQVTVGHEGLDAAKLRSAWQSLRNARDMEFVSVESNDAKVRIAKSGRFLLANVDPTETGHDGKVQVRVPLEVVDALLDAPDGQLNVKAAIQALAAEHTGDLVTVSEGSSRVRIWIDERADAE